MSSINPSTVSKFKQLYSECKDSIEYRIAHGNPYQRAQCNIIKSIAIGNIKEVANENVENMMR